MATGDVYTPTSCQAHCTTTQSARRRQTAAAAPPHRHAPSLQPRRSDSSSTRTPRDCWPACLPGMHTTTRWATLLRSPACCAGPGCCPSEECSRRVRGIKTKDCLPTGARAKTDGWSSSIKPAHQGQRDTLQYTRTPTALHARSTASVGDAHPAATTHTHVPEVSACSKCWVAGRICALGAPQ